jgi:hypothetical protein
MGESASGEALGKIIILTPRERSVLPNERSEAVTQHEQDQRNRRYSTNPVFVNSLHWGDAKMPSDPAALGDGGHSNFVPNVYQVLPVLDPWSRTALSMNETSTIWSTLPIESSSILFTGVMQRCRLIQLHSGWGAL